MPMKQTAKTTAMASLITAMLIFGTIGIFVHYIPLPSSVIALLRGVIGTLFLLVFSRLRGTPVRWAAMRGQLAMLLVSGVVIGFNWILLFEAYNYTTVGVATLCYYMEPTIVTLLSPLLVREKLGGNELDVFAL